MVIVHFYSYLKRKTKKLHTELFLFLINYGLKDMPSKLVHPESPGSANTLPSLYIVILVISFWLRGPEGFNARDLADRLRDKGVLIDIGETFYLSHDTRSFRLGFAFVTMQKLEEGIIIIAEEVKQLLG